MKKSSRKIKIIAIFLLTTFLFEIFTPTVAYALTSGPSSPEFSSFEPVATTNMVDPFTGSLTYNIPILNIPGPDGGDYALSLSYHSGTTCEEESSWVGNGWTLNPGAINKNVKGIPDDYGPKMVGGNLEYDKITYYNKMRPNWTLSVTDVNNMEISSQSIGVSATRSLRFNNYQGFARSYSFGLNFKGWANIGMNMDAAGVTFSANVSFQNIYSGLSKKNKRKLTDDALKGKVKKAEAQKKFEFKPNLKSIGAGLVSPITSPSLYMIYSALEPSMPSSINETKGYSVDFSTSFALRGSILPVGVEKGFKGSFNLQWNKNEEEEIDVCGYNFHNTANKPLNEDAGKIITDYNTERNQMYDKQDLFLGIPFASPDQYIVAVEGIGGSFRPYSLVTNIYFPQEKKNKHFQVGTGVETCVGANLGIGINLGMGYSQTDIDRWKTPFEGTNVYNEIYKQEEVFYKFNNDKGGNFCIGNNNTPNDKIYKNPSFPGAAKGYLTVNKDDYINTQVNNSKSSSSYIEKTTKGFKIFNEYGLCYNFEDVIKSKNEANLSINVFDLLGDNSSTSISNCNTTAFKKMYLKNNYSVNVGEHTTVMGEVKKKEYVSSYLISSITNSNYIDLGLSGFDKSDFGGWTKFSYSNEGLLNAEWYRWRNPFIGLSYAKNEISNKLDDMASVSTGEREIKYLEKIETKTHVAEFNTSLREDAFGAKPPSDTYDLLSESKTSVGCREYQQKKLDKICLYAKGDNYENDINDKKLIKTVYFKYEYSLVNNSPNNKNSLYPNNNPNQNTGKLTLTKVWTEYNGVVNAKISPYEFKYNYKEKDEFSSNVKDLFPQTDAMQNFFNLGEKYTITEENPNYAPYILDGWGNIQYNGLERKNKMQNFLYQGIYNDQVEFDPGAWQLKQIKLPSGGDILIEYEQNDYNNVQDRKAMALVSLLNPDNPLNDIVSEEDYGSSKYYINMEDLGINEDNYPTKNLGESYDAMMSRYAVDLNDYFKEEKIYYKFLYALIGKNPKLDDPYSEYISGYTTILKKDNKFGIEYEASTNSLIFRLDRRNFEQGNVEGPRQAAFDFYRSNRVGMFPNDRQGKKYLENLEGVANTLTGEPDELTISKAVNLFAQPLFQMISLRVNLNNWLISPLPKNSVANYYNCKLSYLKLPLPKGKSKLGGGIRVKRLLMYDAGIENGDAAIYGNEYNYTTTEKIKINEKEVEINISSGVATNEPMAIREENALVSYLPKKKQSWFSRHIVGTNKESSEGPIGESILPGPSVGYSKVKVKNIHSGKTGTGYSIYEYYTVKDYPFDKSYSFEKDNPIYDVNGNTVDWTDLEENTKHDFITIPAGIINFTSRKVWASQGYKFVITNFNGLLKSESSFDENNNLVYSMTKDYFNPGEKVRMMKIVDKVKTWEWVNPGKETDVAIEDKSIRSFNIDFQAELDISVGLTWFPPFYPSADLSFSWNENILKTHVSSKIMQYPIIEKSTTIYKDGIKSKVENIAFDYATGNPVLTKTWDTYDKIPAPSEPNGIHDGSIYSLNIPAHWIYGSMGKKTDNTANMNDLKSSAGNIVTYGIDGDTTYHLNVKVEGTDQHEWHFPEYLSTSGPTCYVLSSSVTTYEQGLNVSDWLDDGIIKYYNVGKDYAKLLTAFNLIYRPYKTYVYKTDIKNKKDDGCKIYEEGLFKKFIPFDFYSTNNGSEWLKTTEITKYSPGGIPLEEKDILDTYSAVLFGQSYKFSQPIMIAQNAKRSEILFFDFENESDLAGAPCHSGFKSKHISSPSGLEIEVTPTNNLINKGMIMMFWSNEPMADKITINQSSNNIFVEKIAQTGVWSLYKAELKFVNTTKVTISISASGANTFIDDLRLQPSDAKAICYVYDKGTLKLLTQFDDQHFGMFYQYNAEGQLVRKMVETEKGMKTLQETQYNVIKSTARP